MGPLCMKEVSPPWMEEVSPPWEEKLNSPWVEKVNIVFLLDETMVTTSWSIAGSQVIYVCFDVRQPNI